jgi:hypothetical protein
VKLIPSRNGKKQSAIEQKVKEKKKISKVKEKRKRKLHEIQSAKYTI